MLEFSNVDGVRRGPNLNQNIATVQVVLHESTGVIDMHNTRLRSIRDGSGMTQGIQNATGSIAHTTINASRFFNSAFQSFRFTPSTLTPSYAWSPVASIISGATSDNALATPLSTTTCSAIYQRLYNRRQCNGSSRGTY